MMIFRDAVGQDIEEIVALLTDDFLGQGRETDGYEQYLKAFKAIEQSPDNRLIVLDIDDEVCGCMQLTIIPCMTHGGTKRAMVEGIRIKRSVRNQGWGGKMLEYAKTEAKKAGCGLLQLTTDKRRPEALRFYKRLGFVDSHEGLKKWL